MSGDCSLTGLGHDFDIPFHERRRRRHRPLTPHNPCKIEDVAYLLPLVSCRLSPSYSGSSFRKSGLGKTPLVATSIFKLNFSKQKHTPIAHQHACIDFTSTRDISCMSSRHVRCDLPLVRPGSLRGWSMKKRGRACCGPLVNVPFGRDRLLIWSWWVDW